MRFTFLHLFILYSLIIFNLHKTLLTNSPPCSKAINLYFITHMYILFDLYWTTLIGGGCSKTTDQATKIEVCIMNILE